MSTPLEPGTVLPLRTLEPLAGGGPPTKIGPNRRRSQVLVAPHAEACEECAAYVRSFDEVTSGLRDENAEMVAVVGPAWEGQALPAGAVLDHGGVRARLSPSGAPAVVIVDRFGQVFSAVDAGDDHRFPHHDRTLAVLLEIALNCPECGVPDVPWGNEFPDPDLRSGGIPLTQ